MPARSSTARCLVIAGAEIGNGAAKLLTEQGPSASRATIARLVGSASAPKISSSAPVPSGVASRPAALRAGGAVFILVLGRWCAPRLLGSRRGHLDDVPFQAIGALQEFGLLAWGDPSAVEGGGNMRHEDGPLRLGNSHALMRELHVTARVVDRPLKGGAEKVDEELVSPAGAVFADPFPIHRQRRIATQPTHQVMNEGRDRVVAADASIKRLLRRCAVLRIEHSGLPKLNRPVKFMGAFTIVKRSNSPGAPGRQNE